MKTTKTLMILALTVLAVAVTARSDSHKAGSITGCLTDMQTGLPIVGAWVAVFENNLGARTDSTGCFTIDNLAPGVFNLVVTHPDYGTVQGLADLRTTVKAGLSATVAAALNRSPKSDSDAEYKKDQSLMDAIVDWSGLGSGREGEERGNESRSGSAERPNIGIPAPGEVPDLSCPPRDGFAKVRREPYRVLQVEEGDYQGRPRDMFFRDYGTNGFIDTRRDRFSTFATDVDDASYTLARRYLQEGTRVPPDAVRVEEFINHFDYGYNVPGDDKFRVFTELTDSPYERGRQIMKVAVKGREIDRRARKPLNITFVIDVSGSMNRGRRFSLVRRSVDALVQQLNRHDRVGIVAYGSNAYNVLEPIPADRRRQVLDAMNSLHPGGSTYAEAGIRLGYEMANRQYVNGHNNIIILCSDGVANVGQTSPDAIMRDIEEFARKGISLNSYGYGMGNYNDVLLERLAQKGNGRYAYVNDKNEVQKAFVDDFVGNSQVLARDVKVQVEFNPKLVQSYRLLGYENRDVADHRFRDNRQDGGEIGAGHEVTALYELVMPKRRSGGKIATVFVRWKNADETEVSELSRDVKWNKNRRTFDRSRPELRLAIVAGRFAEMLKGTSFAAGTSWDELYRIAEPLRRDLPGEQTDELLELIRRAGSLSPWFPEPRDGDDDGYFSNYKR